MTHDDEDDVVVVVTSETCRCNNFEILDLLVYYIFIINRKAFKNNGAKPFSEKLCPNYETLKVY